MASDRSCRRAKDSPEGWWHRVLEFLAAVIEPFMDFWERSAAAIDAKIYGIKRRRRKTAVAFIALGAMALSLLFWTAMLAADTHDARVANTQPTVEATMVGEDLFDCRARIELNGSEHEAVTSCGQRSFAPGDTVWVAQGPAEPGRYVLVVPGEEWWIPDAIDYLVGIGLSVVIGLLMWVAGYMGLLRADAPSKRKPAKRRMLADGAPGRDRSEPEESLLADAADTWEETKVAVGNWLERFFESDIRLRGSLMSLLIIVVLAVAVNMSLGISRQLESDRALIPTQPVIETVLLDYGYKDSHPEVRHENTIKELAYELAIGEGEELGDPIRVVVDPYDSDRLIPVSVATTGGILAWAKYYGAIWFAATAALALTGYLLIGHEVGNVVSAVMRRLGFGY